MAENFHDDLAALANLCQGNEGKVGSIIGRLKSQLEGHQAPRLAKAHRELFLAAYALLADRYCDAAFTRLYNAMGALDEHYGIDSPAAFQMLNTLALAQLRPAEVADEVAA